MLALSRFIQNTIYTYIVSYEKDKNALLYTQRTYLHIERLSVCKRYN